MVNHQVGYQIFHHDGMDGARGTYYNYVLAGNGLFIEAESPLLTGRVQIVQAEVRGLPPLAPEIHLTHGKIPSGLVEMAMYMMQFTPDVETYLGIILKDGAYQLANSSQIGTTDSVTYICLDNVVLELHSHAGRAFFSDVDDQDEQGFRLYGVLGNLDMGEETQITLRLGMYGYFSPVKWADIIDGPLPILSDFPRKQLLLEV